MQVLLIEDDDTIAEPLREGLERYGLQVERVATGAEALRGPYGDIVLLDLGLPDMDGIDVCHHLRRVSAVPIIMLTARGTEADRVVGLEIGADDYLAKPFSIRELIARIRAVTRRTTGFPGLTAAPPASWSHQQPQPEPALHHDRLHHDRLHYELPHQDLRNETPAPAPQAPSHQASPPWDPHPLGAEPLPPQPWSQTSVPHRQLSPDGFPSGAAFPAPAPYALEQTASTGVPEDPPRPGSLVVDPRTRQVWVGETPVALTPKEFDLLALLTEDPGAVCSRQQIISRVWDPHFHGPTKTLDVHVASLRRKLGDPAWIHTVRGVGFRLAVRHSSGGPAPGSGPAPGTAAGACDPGVRPDHAPRHFR
ncbi:MULTISPECIES: response regulator transcription factor [Streptomyces]|uniref:Response regulator n=2 Tax=Streptomyces TaxID=1883 RepID=A0A3R7HT15_9ACTN|nr:MULTISPECIES: response regulator transcription factor [Streptomyces]KNE81996.1 hypothetical protein ADZ36_13365 [Streptomyces fradiae]PQM19562.1 DNA-binding response regulator [Streptomyces xinghaiensis]RKM90198.1 response regulator [Streptomyces xinghaiensis]RNC69117.1 response regulator [Streptomyces xinghaiensis]